MIQRIVNSPIDTVTEKIRASVLFRKRPPGYYTQEHCEVDMLFGGKTRNHYWIYAREQGNSLGLNTRYFSYKLISLGENTLIKGRFIFPLWYRVFPFVLFIFGCACFFLNGINDSIWGYAKLFLAVFIIDIVFYVFIRIINMFGITRYREKMIMDFLKSLTEI